METDLCWVYLKLTPYYIIRVEREMNHGYADFVLMPNPKYDNVEHAYIIELKYIIKDEDSENARQTKMAETEE